MKTGNVYGFVVTFLATRGRNWSFLTVNFKVNYS